MMLTYDEVKEVCAFAMDQDPDDFAKQVADYMPQSIIPRLMMDVTKARMDIYDDLDRAAGEAANFMMGMHVGWALAVAAHVGT